MRSWMLILLGVVGAWHYTDMLSQSLLRGMVAPIVFGSLLFALIIRVIRLLDSDSSADRGEPATLQASAGQHVEDDVRCNSAD